ncbi:MAG: glycosyltransferase family 87 protein, partial [bacterium]
YYKYSPFVLFFFFPYCIFPFEIAAIIHFFVLSAVIIYVLILARDILRNYFLIQTQSKENLILSLVFICVLLHFVKELHLGNINVVLLLLLCLSVYSILKKRDFLGGLLFGVVVLTKPFFLILLLPLLFRKKWFALTGLAGALVLGSLVPSIFFGFQKSIDLHTVWIKTMFLHNAFYPGRQSVQCLIQYYVNPNVPNEFQYLIIACGALLFFGLFLVNRSFEKANGNPVQLLNAGLTIEWFFLIAVLPNLVKTDSEHFMSTLPLILLIIYYLSEKKNYWLILVAFILFFLYGGNSTDLLGKTLSERLFNMGLIGISNMGIIALALWIYLKDTRIRISHAPG